MKEVFSVQAMSKVKILPPVWVTAPSAVSGVSLKHTLHYLKTTLKHGMGNLVSI